MSGKTKKGKSWLLLLRRYLCFFLLMAFAITCCMVLFLNIITTTTGIVFTRDNLEHAAVATFLNVLLLSLIFTVIDGLRRRFLVERPVRRIVNAAEQLQKGDFSVRIKPIWIILIRWQRNSRVSKRSGPILYPTFLMR